MTHTLKLTWVYLKLFIREPIALFFTLIFPVMMLILFGFIYGNDPDPMFGGLGSADVSVAGYTAMIIAVSALISLPITLSTDREKGILRRYRATPVRPLSLLFSHLAVMFVIVVTGLGILVAVGNLMFGLRFPGSITGVALAFLLSTASFLAFGFLISSLFRKARTTQAVGMFLTFPMIFLSGAAMPRETLPETILKVSEYLPLTHVVTLLRGFWAQKGCWGDYLTETAVLVGLLLVSVSLSTRLFRWE